MFSVQALAGTAAEEVLVKIACPSQPATTPNGWPA